MTTTTTTERRRGRLTGYHLLGVIVAVCALLSTILLGVQSIRYNKASDCLAGYTESYNEVLRERDNVAAAGRQDAREKTIAERKMWDAFIENASRRAGQQPTQAQRDASFAAVQRYFKASDSYLGALDRSDQARLRYPVPPNLCPKPRTSTATM